MPFDASEYLDSKELIAEYLAAALENPNPNVFLEAARDVSKARGVAKLAQDAGVGRESLYKSLKPDAKPHFETVRKLLDALRVRLNSDLTYSTIF